MTTDETSISARDDVRHLAMHCTATGYFEGAGSFFLTHYAAEKGSKEQRKCYLLSVERPSGEIIRAKDILETSYVPQGLFAINETTLLVLASNNEKTCFLKSRDDWKGFDIFSPSKSSFNTLLNSIVPNLHKLNHSSNLSKFRHGGGHDFTLVCAGEDEIPVHSVYLSCQWPFFKNTLESNMTETRSRTLLLNHPVSWIEAMVSHFYDERKQLDFDTAVGVLVVAQIYQVPDLLTQAITRIKEEDMDIHQALQVWKQVGQVDNSAVKEYCANKIRLMMSTLYNSSTSQDLLSDLTQAQFIRLFNDMSLSAQQAISV